MPAKSKAQAIMISIALHNPGKLYKRNKSVMNMDKYDMEDYASTKHKDLPYRAGDGKFK